MNNEVTTLAVEKDGIMNATLNQDYFLVEDKTIYGKASPATFLPLVNGEKAFTTIYEKISAATKSVEIICWAFQPSMYFNKNGSAMPIGELLAKLASEGKESRVLCWQTPLGSEKWLDEDNTPGRSVTVMPRELWTIVKILMDFYKLDYYYLPNFIKNLAKDYVDNGKDGENNEKGDRTTQLYFDMAWYGIVDCGDCMTEDDYNQEQKQLEQYAKSLANIPGSSVSKWIVNGYKGYVLVDNILNLITKALGVAAFKERLEKLKSALFQSVYDFEMHILMYLLNNTKKAILPATDDLAAIQQLKKTENELRVKYNNSSKGMLRHTEDLLGDLALKLFTGKDTNTQDQAEKLQALEMLRKWIRCQNYSFLKDNKFVHTLKLMQTPVAERKLFFASRDINDTQLKSKLSMTDYIDKDLSSLTKEMLDWAPTHHQKTVMIDYPDPKKAVGFVMGHNMLERYWDNDAHTAHTQNKFAFKGKIWSIPRQDVSCIVTGEILHDINENFMTAWNHVDGVAQLNHNIAKKNFIPRAQLGALLQAQILRTQPQYKGKTTKTVQEIADIYLQNIKKAVNYIYMENQYFRWTPLIQELKVHWKNMKSSTGSSVKHPLYLFIVTNSSDEGLGPGVRNTYKILEEIGRADTMPRIARDYRLEELTTKATKQQLTTDEVEEKNKLEGLQDGFFTSKSETTNNLREHLKQDLTKQGIKAVVCTLAAPFSDAPKPKWSEFFSDDPKPKWQEVYIHSKVSIIDDVHLMIGSANINSRSMQVDSEIGIATEHDLVAKNLRQQLWKIHTSTGTSRTNDNYLNPERGFLFGHGLDLVFNQWESVAKKNTRERDKGNSPLDNRSLSEFLIANTLEDSVTEYKSQFKYYSKRWSKRAMSDLD